MTADTSNTATEIAPVVSPSTLALFAQMAVGIPEADDSEAYEAIVLKLLGATEVDGLNAPWDTSNGADLVGYRLKIESIERRTSDYAGGLGLYLVCKGVNVGTGEPFTWTTGSVSIVAQLTRAWHLKAFPVIAELVVADTPTANGYRPQHLQVHSLSVNK